MKKFSRIRCPNWPKSFRYASLMTREICEFSSCNHFEFFVWIMKVPASSSRPMHVFVSSLNVTFIQFYTGHDCFSLTDIDLIFLSFWVNATFRLCFLCVHPISFSWFLQVKNINSAFNPFVFNLCLVLFLSLRHIFAPNKRFSQHFTLDYLLEWVLRHFLSS